MEGKTPHLSDNLESETQLTTPTLRQIHVLSANSLEAATGVSEAVVTQQHALFTADLESSVLLDVPALHQVHIFLGASLESESSVTIPDMGVIERVPGRLAFPFESVLAGSLQSPVRVGRVIQTIRNGRLE
jgi:hypothetical protein